MSPHPTRADSVLRSRPACSLPVHCRSGTASMGRIFGPVMLGWFIVLAVAGASVDPVRAASVARDQSRARDRISREPSGQRARCACRRVPHRHRRRGARLRGHGPLRQDRYGWAGCAWSYRRSCSIALGKAPCSWRIRRRSPIRSISWRRRGAYCRWWRLRRRRPSSPRRRSGRVLRDALRGEPGAVAACAHRALVGLERRADLCAVRRAARWWPPSPW